MGITDAATCNMRPLGLLFGALWSPLFILLMTCCWSFSSAFVSPQHRPSFHSTQSLASASFKSSASYPQSHLILSARTEGLLDINSWFPYSPKYDDDIFNDDDDDDTAELEEKAILLAGRLIRNRLERVSRDNADDEDDGSGTESDSKASKRVVKLVKDRFMDLAGSIEGETALESLFDDPAVAACKDDNVIRGAIMALQSLCVMGTQTGLKGPPEQLQRMVSHLDRRDSPELLQRDLYEWDRGSIRRLKYQLDRSAGTELLAELLWKRTAQGAFDILVEIGAWNKHEDLALLRSGFPLRFTEVEDEAARAAFDLDHDPDQMLGLRKDFRDMKVYTVDSASTSEIDDGLSVEVVEKEDGSQRHRLWVHIADADRWAPRHSPLFQAARQRITSLYLPLGSIPMFPSIVSSDLMSLKANQDACALSLGVELNDDGSIDTSTIVFTPSVIQVSYRLTYDDVDEMLEEGIGYSEEWELGALLDAANKRREHRIRNGSTEGMVPNPVPYSTVSIEKNMSAPDDIDVSVNIEVSHNAGKNRTAEADGGLSDSDSSLQNEPVSSAYLLVTESMIMAGEALGRWKMRLEQEDEHMSPADEASLNQLRLPFRTQPQPDFKSRARERNTLEDLLEGNVGGGLCHAWYVRRFLQPVKVTESRMPHWGLGLDCYVQWTSPIRRFADLQTHASIKRYLRRRRVHEIIAKGEAIPSSLTSGDLGWASEFDMQSLNDGNAPDDLDGDLDFLEGIGLNGAARTLQRQSKQYWLYEHVRRQREQDPDVTYTALVLGCVDQAKCQYAVYVQELGLETRYNSPAGKLNIGITLTMKVDRVSPRAGILYFVRAV